ncbi:hypothetical protein Q3G72_029229 [Acer saccharum]|nr:hypothetical protein Q3G72_029229 [Acer saccharum]
MVSTGEFFKMKNRATDQARTNWSLSIKKHVDTSLESLRIQMKEWCAYCRSKGKMPHPMHLEVFTASAFSTFYACQKAGINGEDPDVGSVPGKITVLGWITRTSPGFVRARVYRIVGVVCTGQHSCVSYQPFWWRPEQFSSLFWCLGFTFLLRGAFVLS